jgi:CheY-like chemotaxis protein
VGVADNGRGIAPEFLPHLFEPFSQTEDALTREQGGLGLGLSIAHQLATLHRGTLVATSAGPGRGATLTLTLPALEAPAEPRPASRNATIATSVLEGVRVLIVDDDRRVREALSLLLGRSGAIVETAENTASARARLANRVPDALVCDIAMPGEDGYSFLRTIREGSTSIREIPAIAVTAHASSADGQRALASGFDLHLPKPIDLELLVASIRDLVTARRSSPR